MPIILYASTVKREQIGSYSALYRSGEHQMRLREQINERSNEKTYGLRSAGQAEQE